MKKFIRTISNIDISRSSEKMLKIDIEELNNQIISSLVGLISGKDPVQNISYLAHYLTIYRVDLISFISLYYLFIQGSITHDMLVEGSTNFYEVLSSKPFNGQVPIFLSISEWMMAIKIPFLIKNRWSKLKWKAIDRSIFFQPEITRIPHSTSTLIEKKSFNDYEKVIPVFSMESPHLENKIETPPSNLDAQNQEEQQKFTEVFEGERIESLGVSKQSNTHNLQSNFSLHKNDIKVDVLFLTKAKTTIPIIGKWIRGTASLNEFSKEITLSFLNKKKVVLEVESSYYTWKSNWVQFRLINGLRLVLRCKGLFEIEERLKIVQFAMNCRCHYFEDMGHAL
eukprot:NODE_63_length_25098_cov_0.440498.p8 type:complete len:339 gc:universal NODE_63_length_25098_cov_0.440498:1266-250(-)